MGLKNLYILILSAFFFVSCGVEEPLYTVPWAKVYLQIETGGRDKILNGTYSTKIFTRENTPSAGANSYFGFSGILVMNVPPINGTGFGLVAFDLCCPHEDQRLTTISIEKDGLTAKCNKCKTVYSLINGGIPLSGVGKERLQQYQISRAANNSSNYIVRN